MFHFASSDNEILQAMYRVMTGGGLGNNPVTGGGGQKFVSIMDRFQTDISQKSSFEMQLLNFLLNFCY